MSSAWLLRVWLGVVCWAIVACTADATPPAPTEPAAAATAVAVASSHQVASVTVRPPATATVATIPALPTSAPILPTSTPTRQAQPTPIPPGAPAATAGLLRLQDNLDDPLGYCIDVRGFGASIRLDADLQAHSCKSSSADDQSFTMTGDPLSGSIRLVEYDVCLAVADRNPGASILLRPCDDQSVSRDFEWLADGRLHLLVERDASQPELCIGVADGIGEPAGGRNHLRRDLMLLPCDEVDPARITWGLE